LARNSVIEDGDNSDVLASALDTALQDSANAEFGAYLLQRFTLSVCNIFIVEYRGPGDNSQIADAG
jgi:hypothetical protein